MALEITGKVIRLMDPQTGESSGRQWQKGTFVIETEGTYPKKVCCVVWGDKLNQVNGLKEGDTVKASIEIESREYNNKWYTDVKAWKIEKVEGSGPTTPHTTTGTATPSSYQKEPGKEEVRYQDISADSSSTGDGADDLPF